jgi:hypothetical protein
MLNFDREVEAWAKATSSTYLRYSDDILVITDADLQAEASDLVTSALAKQDGCMSISEEKTEVSRFEVLAGNQVTTKPLTYLGFTFDGTLVRLRDRTLSRFYRRMTYATRGTAKRARQAAKQGGVGQPFRRQLFRDFSHLGRANFYGYATRAQAKFGGTAIRRQLRNHFKVLLRKLMNRGK